MPFIYFFYTWSFLIFISSNHWFILWMALELNSIMFVSMLVTNKTSQEYTSAITYFLTQSTASLILIFSLFNMEINNVTNSSSPKMLLLLALMMKIASAPVHNWLPSVALFTQTPTNLWLLLTTQKMMPLMMLILCKPQMNTLTISCMIMSLILGPMMNFNQNNSKSILAYSSISHAGWFITASICCQESWTPYFFSYSILLYMISKKTTHKTLLQQSLMMNQTNLFMALFLLLSLGGLPPFLGFFPKIMILQTTIKLEFISLTMILLMSSITDLFIYTRLSYMALMNKKSNLIWMKKEKYFSFFILTISASLFSAMIIV